MDKNFLPERMNFWENVVLNFTVPMHKYFINVYGVTTEYEENTKSSIAIVSQINSLCIIAHLILFLVPVIL